MKKLLLAAGLITCTFHASAQWTDLGSGINISEFDFFSMAAVDANTVWAVGNGPGDTTSSFSRTIDGGTTWITDTLPFFGQDYNPLNVQALDDQTAWVLFTNRPNQDHGRVVKTTDGGATWVEQFGGFNQTGHALATMHFWDANDGVLYGSPGTGDAAIDTLQMYTTGDGGTTWTRVTPSTLPAPLPGEGNWVQSGNGQYDTAGDTIWGTSRADRIFRSTDRGLTWEAFTVGSASNLRGVAFQDHLNGIITGVSPNYIGKTTDGGETWTDITINAFTSYRAVEYVPGTAGTFVIWSGTSSNPRLLITRDGGNTWDDEVHLPQMICLQFINDSIGYGATEVTSATEGGIYAWDGDITTSIEALLNRSQGSIRAYPNPAQAVVSIQGFEGAGLQEAIVFDLSGKQVLVVGKSELQNRAIQIPVEELEAGPYLIRVTTTTGQVFGAKFMKK